MSKELEPLFSNADLEKLARGVLRLTKDGQFAVYERLIAVRGYYERDRQATAQRIAALEAELQAKREEIQMPSRRRFGSYRKFFDGMYRLLTSVVTPGARDGLMRTYRAAALPGQKVRYIKADGYYHIYLQVVEQGAKNADVQSP